MPGLFCFVERCKKFGVIPEAAKRLSGIHIPGDHDSGRQGLWIPGSSLRDAPE
jgi:hypothetical protein